MPTPVPPGTIRLDIGDGNLYQGRAMYSRTTAPIHAGIGYPNGYGNTLCGIKVDMTGEDWTTDLHNGCKMCASVYYIHKRKYGNG